MRTEPKARTLETVAAAEVLRRCMAEADNVGAFRAGFTDYMEKIIHAPEGETLKVIPKARQGAGRVGFVDWVTFTAHEDSIQPACGFPLVPVSDEEAMALLSAKLEMILGYGITSKRPIGLNFYQRSYVLGDNWGHVCHGGQRNTFCVIISGEGCAAAREGWEQRLYEFLQKLINARITRLDVSHDDIAGHYTVDNARKDFDEGLFRCHARNPQIEMAGNWVEPNGKGRTLYIGRRQSGKFARIYEKGKQLGDVASPWVRIEVEFKNEDRVIPFRALLEPGEYLAGAFPAFAFLTDTQERILTKSTKAKCDLNATLSWLRRQCGKTLFCVSVVLGGHAQAMEAITPADLDESDVPKRFKIADWQNAPRAVHKFINANQEPAPMWIGEPAFGEKIFACENMRP
ncbi:MAG: hypothetical protein EG826_15575 [Deltaproteobacteria bacterium]|nr:hypothetical protein [Deltaproteobacteria bacterium]